MTERPSPPRVAVLKTMLSQRDSHCVRVNGSSMLPSFRDGDQAIIESCGNIRFGDIIIIEDRGKFVIHRAVRFRKSLIGRIVLTKGDHVGAFDPRWTPIDAVLGRVREVHRDRTIYSYNRRSCRIRDKLMAVLSRIEGHLYDLTLGLRPSFNWMKFQIKQAWGRQR